ncbi:MAG: SLATT domain-containing protein [Cryobacterium sp.]|nr:SLATT domain-containing protein [Cryobacterium sp.]
MKRLRTGNFESRRDAYLELRTRDQRKWYSNKARSNAVSATVGRYALLVGEFGAVVAAALALNAGRIVDIAGIIAALIASGAAWVAIKQYSQLTSAYRVAAIELALQEDSLGSVVEEKWPQAVADAEEAISREHTMWLASRGSGRITKDEWKEQAGVKSRSRGKPGKG